MPGWGEGRGLHPAGRGVEVGGLEAREGGDWMIV